MLRPASRMGIAAHQPALQRIETVVTWWQVILVFVGIPTAICAVITVVVVLFSRPGVPEGIAALSAQQETSGQDSGNGHDGELSGNDETTSASQ